MLAAQEVDEGLLIERDVKAGAPVPQDRHQQISYAATVALDFHVVLVVHLKGNAILLRQRRVDKLMFDRIPPEVHQLAMGKLCHE